MDNRYGRHGPHAWRRWHERHFHRCSSYFDNSAYTVIVHVQLPPVKTERIIFIIMPNTADFEEEGDFAEIRSDLSSISLSQSTVNDGQIVNKATWQALEDLEELASLSERGELLILNRDAFKQRSVRMAKRAIKELYSGERAPNSTEYTKMIAEYQESYQNRFNDGLNGTAELCSEDEIQLHEMAIEDRRNAPQYRDYHIRDLAVIRVLTQTGVPAREGQEHLTEIHNLADFYQNSYSNPREAVYWPRQESF